MKTEFNKAVTAYRKAFEKKQGNLTFEYWVSDDVGTIAEYNDGIYFIDFQDIKFDIDNNIKSGKFIEYYHLCMDNHYKGRQQINYKTFNMIYK
jgi:hypothetical protein